MRKNKIKQCGQAMLELLLIIFSVSILMIILIITAAWGEADNARFLHMKRDVELKSVSETTTEASEYKEITSWARKSVDLYGDGEKTTIPFTPADYPYTGNNSIENADQELKKQLNSSSENYTYQYHSQQEFGQNSNNKIEQLNDINSTQAAELVMSGDANDNSNNSYDNDIWKNSKITEEISNLFYRLCGYNLPSPQKNETNKVFFPIHQ